MKKVPALLLAIFLCFSMSACSEDQVTGMMNGKPHIEETPWRGVRDKVFDIILIHEITDTPNRDGYEDFRLVQCDVLYSSDPSHCEAGNIFLYEGDAAKVKPGELYLVEYLCYYGGTHLIEWEEMAAFHEGHLDFADSPMSGIAAFNTMASAYKKEPKDWYPPLPEKELTDGATVGETVSFLEMMGTVFDAVVAHGDIYVPGVG